ncbi:ABC transporter ATP-binding protein [Oceanispirochaeta crateris]|uniref:ABC transporter ATP-binding protein n=1 Tax=Oceanispirochaeta crateris TaxID=2518645 RepID=A0A5C1QH08_9SPIO|nr:ABC transporter ATP-binding protein [Oceanispirochaeta crateris]QEN06608.1 ABC transporter ATP-binding protein [Oceanispirochaeta crateris]
MNKKMKVEIKNLTKTFITNKNDQVKAVDNINLTINPGEFVCLLGPSGCGKTTTLRMLAGFEIPTKGEILIGNENVANLTPDKRDTAMVFQNYALFPHMNVYDNISYGLRIKKLPKAEVHERVDRILKLMKMEDFAQRVPSEMSGGQQQRVSLARALIMESGVLLFDEPLSNLDAKLRLHMRDEIRKIQKEVGISSIYVTHDQEEAMGLSDKIVIMKDGTIQQIGSPREIYQKPINAFVAQFIGRANILDGQIVGDKGDTVVLDVHGVQYVTEKTTKHKVGDKVQFMIRPESFNTSEKDFKAEVTKSVFMGSHHEYEVSIFGKTFEISENNPMRKITADVGEILSFSMDPNSIHILEK